MVMNAQTERALRPVSGTSTVVLIRIRWRRLSRRRVFVFVIRGESSGRPGHLVFSRSLKMPRLAAS